MRLDRSDVHGSTEPERWASSHSVQGQRERLAVLGYLPDGRDGPWDVPDRAAVTIFQFDHGFEATGALDERSTQELDSLAWGTFYLGNGRE
ncbi:MAG: peptidoglycan-binding domain-containing protein [Myxococcota bacterium]